MPRTAVRSPDDRRSRGQANQPDRALESRPSWAAASGPEPDVVGGPVDGRHVSRSRRGLRSYLAAAAAFVRPKVTVDCPSDSPVEAGSVEADWVGRARRAAATFAEIAL